MIEKTIIEKYNLVSFFSSIKKSVPAGTLSKFAAK